MSAAIKMMSCLSIGFSLMGCTTTLPVPQALDYQSISAVEAEIKREIGLYMVAAARLEPTIIDQNKTRVILSNDRKDYACGGGDIRFDISSVQADLLVTDENIGNFGGGIATPTATISGGLSEKISRDTTNTQELVYNVWFDPLSKQDPSQEFLQQVVSLRYINSESGEKESGGANSASSY